MNTGDGTGQIDLDGDITATGFLLVEMGADQDDVSITSTIAATSDVTVNTGADVDSLLLTDTGAISGDNLAFDTGEGDGRIDFDGAVTAGGTLEIDMGTATDVVEITSTVQSTGDMSMRLMEGVDTIVVTDTGSLAGANITLDTDEGTSGRVDLDGTVTAITGAFHIDMGAGADVIDITAGVSAATTLQLLTRDGQDSVTVTATGALSGKDITVDTDEGEGRIDLDGDVTASGFLLLDMGDDQDDIDITSTVQATGAIDFDTHAGADTINLTDAGAISGADIEMDTGEGQGRIDLDGDVTASGLFRVDMGGDADDVDITSSVTSVSTFDIATGEGFDTVNLTSAGVLSGSALTIDTGNGGGRTDIDGSVSATSGALTITSGSGRDIVDVTGSLTGAVRLDILTGAERDEVYATNAALSAPIIEVQTGTGADEVLVTDSTSTGAMAIRTGDQDDFIQIIRPDNQAAGDSLLIDGGSHADDIVIQTWGSTAGIGVDYLITVSDSGGINPANGADTLEMLGTGDNDTFLSRAGFVALLHGTEDQIRGLATGRPASVERIDYDRSLNGRFSMIGGAGDDLFISDDNATTITMDGGLGADSFQIGQLFGSDPVAGGTYTENGLLVSNGIELGDDIATVETTRGFLSRGGTFAITAFGGEGADDFTVYSNKAEVRLEGENGNDEFVVRAFLLADTGQLNGQGNVGVTAGGGDDAIQYNINAPVDIDGGEGFDKVVVLGTEGNDTLVVTEEGVFGAGLNVRLSENEEALEVDALEGDDTIFVQSTKDGTVTTVIGGLGSDTINVAGDVTGAVYSAEIEGRSAEINHLSQSGDSDYQNLLLSGLTPIIADAEQGQIVVAQTGEDTAVAEGGALDSYTVRLADVPDAGKSVFVTISAGISSRQDRRLSVPQKAAGDAITLVGSDLTRLSGSWLDDGFGDWQGLTLSGAGDNDGNYTIAAISSNGRVITINETFAVDVTTATTDIAVAGQEAASVLISADGSTFTDGVVLEFTDANWDQEQTITVRAEDDAAQEGDRDVMISHAVDSADTQFDKAKVANIVVEVADNDLAEVKLVESGYDTFVQEGSAASQITDTYEIVLTRQPAPGETVTLTLTDTSNSGDISLSASTLTFTEADWDQPQLVTVTAIALDGVENPERFNIVHAISTNGTVYAAAENKDLSVVVSDGDSAGIVLRESDGKTLIIDQPGEVDSYTLRLSKAPAAGETVKVIVVDQGQTRVVASPRVTTSTLFSGAIPLEFIRDPDAADRIVRTDGGNFRTDGFVQGLVMDITGTTDNDGAYAIAELSEDGSTITVAAGQFLKDETVTAGITILETSVTFTDANWDQAVTVTLEADPSFVPSQIDRITRSFPAEPHRLDLIAGPLVIDGGAGSGRELKAAVMLPTERDPGPLDITTIDEEAEQNDRVNLFNDGSLIADTGRMYNDANGILNVDGLGMGSGTVAIDQGPGLPDLEFARGISIDRTEIVELMLGQGDDTFTVEGTNIASDFDTADANAVNLPITQIHGGGGADTITVSEITKTTGDYHALLVIYGDTDAAGARYNFEGGVPNGNAAVFNAVDFPDDHGDLIDASAALDPSDTATLGVAIYGGVGEDTIIGSAGRDHISGGSGDDDISAGAGNDLIYGDNGFTVDLVARTLVQVALVDDAPQFRSADTRQGGQDIIKGEAGDDIVFGDHGLITQTAGTHLILSTGDLTRAETTDTGRGEDDQITLLTGNDIAFGGAGEDTLHATAGANILLGDHGLIDWTSSDGDTASIDLVESISDVSGADDSLTTQGTGADILIGGEGADTISGADGDNLVIGDTARITGFTGGAGLGSLALELATIEATNNAHGGDDTITVGAGTDVVIAGVGVDSVVAGEGDNLVLGDLGRMHWHDGAGAANPLMRVEGVQDSTGAGDVITTGTGVDLILGGEGADTITGDDGTNIILGDLGQIFGHLDGAAYGQLNLTPARIESTDPGIGGDDDMSTGTGTDIVLGGFGSDTIVTTGGDNILIGDHGVIDWTISDSDPASIDLISTLAESVGAGDTITAGAGDDVIIGGAGSDTLAGGDGTNVILADAGQITGRASGSGMGALALELDQIISLRPDMAGDDDVTGGVGTDYVLGGSGSDVITLDDVGSASDVVVADNGLIRFRVAVSGDVTPVILQARSLFVRNGGDDSVTTSAEGSDIILGGSGGDTLAAGGGNDLILGDNGMLAGHVAAPVGAALISLARVQTSYARIGARDVITTGAGASVIFAGAGDDDVDTTSVATLDAADIVFGDHGRALFDVPASATPQPIALLLQSLDLDQGGADTLRTGLGSDIVVGGFAADSINASDGANIVFGDHGELEGTTDTALAQDGLPISLARLATLAPTIGMGDQITTGTGADIVLGGAGGDQIKANDGDGPAVFDASNILLGDHGEIVFLNPLTGANLPTLIRSVDPTIGGDDVIQSGAGYDMIIGGTGADEIFGHGGSDVIAGDHLRAEGLVTLTTLPLTAQGVADFEVISIFTDSQSGAGADVIDAGAGDDLVLGQQGADIIHGRSGDDDLIGGHNVSGGHDTGDMIDGGAGDDVVLGDNGTIYRKTGANGAASQFDARMRVLEGEALYGTNSHASQGAINDGKPLVTDAEQVNVDGTVQRTILLLDHGDGVDPALYGDDYIAGGSEDDLLFGQMGDDTIQGDGSIDLDQDGVIDLTQGTAVAAGRGADGFLDITTSIEDFNGLGRDGDDYIEGNAGDDVIFGNLGRDDIIGGSSSLYGLTDRTLRADGSDLVFGGAGINAGRNDLGDLDATAHARDNDVIAGDNANIFRIVGTASALADGYLTFQYDTYSTALRIIPRAVDLLDYTEGGADVDAAAAAPDRGAADEVHGEDGDDVIYGQLGGDALFGDAKSDDIIGGTGHDWISGGSGVDGVIGDDGRIMTSRNSTTTGEPLHGIDALDAVDQLVISGDQDAVRAVLNHDGMLVKHVNLTPFSTNPTNPDDQYWRATEANDIIFGGWGSDYLHGGVGSDAISGAEALPVAASPQDHRGHIISFDTPINPGTTTAVNETEFRNASSPAVHLVFLPLLNQDIGRAHISFNANNEVTLEAGNNPFFLNFDHTEGQLDARSENGYLSDGDDRIFGAIGNDILFGGTGKDRLYGGYGNDLISADDNLATTGVDNDATPNVDESLVVGLNDSPDEDISYEDFAFGGAGRDFLIANTAGDRLIDWVGDFNEYFLPYRSAGAPTVITDYSVELEDFIVAQAKADGVDPTRARDVDPTLSAAGIPLSLFGEPYGELGLVNSDNTNPVNLEEFRKQSDVDILSGRGTVDYGAILGPPVIPTGARLAASTIDNFGITIVPGQAGLYTGDASDVSTPVTGDTGPDRPGGAQITTFTSTLGIVVNAGAATIGGLNPDAETAAYVYDENNDIFILSNDAAVPQVKGTNTLLEFFDANGSLFAYVDQTGAVWIIDDIDDNPGGQPDSPDPVSGLDDTEDGWLLESTVAANGVAAVAQPYRSLRGRELD